MVEATSVAPEGRISPGDLGLWDSGQMEPLARISRFADKQGCVPALQLAHAGRKASKTSNWGVEAQHALKPGEGGWSILHLRR
jgi:2,4-dienoyl-CoA reductase-like NADH-dependent reductase (Old Yellow Enzyme family)